MAKGARTRHRYPPFTTALPSFLRARLQAASTVLGVPVDEIVEAALEKHLESLDESQLELIDRFASEVLVRTEPD